MLVAVASPSDTAARARRKNGQAERQSGSPFDHKPTKKGAPRSASTPGVVAVSSGVPLSGFEPPDSPAGEPPRDG
jgi:hypothetical protein